jgi:hypothetical protein
MQMNFAAGDDGCGGFACGFFLTNDEICAIVKASTQLFGSKVVGTDPDGNRTDI